MGDIEPVLAPPLDFDEPTWLQIGDAEPLKMIDFDSSQTWGHAVEEVASARGSLA